MSKVTIIIEMEKLPNGVIKTKTDVVGGSYYWYEIIGALEVLKNDLIVQSQKTATEIIEKEGKG